MVLRWKRDIVTNRLQKNKQFDETFKKRIKELKGY